MSHNQSSYNDTSTPAAGQRVQGLISEIDEYILKYGPPSTDSRGTMFVDEDSDGKFTVSYRNKRDSYTSASAVPAPLAPAAPSKKQDAELVSLINAGYGLAEGTLLPEGDLFVLEHNKGEYYAPRKVHTRDGTSYVRVSINAVTSHGIYARAVIETDKAYYCRNPDFKAQEEQAWDARKRDFERSPDRRLQPGWAPALIPHDEFEAEMKMEAARKKPVRPPKSDEHGRGRPRSHTVAPRVPPPRPPRPDQHPRSPPPTPGPVPVRTGPNHPNRHSAPVPASATHDHRHDRHSGTCGFGSEYYYGPKVEVNGQWQPHAMRREEPVMQEQKSRGVKGAIKKVVKRLSCD